MKELKRKTKKFKKKSEAVTLTSRGGLQGCEMLRIPHCLDNQLTDGGEIVSLTRWPPSIPQKHFFSASVTPFCYRPSQPQDINAVERIMQN
jgi:hypothetical protein